MSCMEIDDHDQRFKSLLQEFLPEFMDLFFPHWVDRFDFAGTEWPNVEAFLDPPEGERKVLDLIAKVPTKLSTSNRPDDCLVLIHIEVEAGDSGTRLRERMLQYYAYLRRNHRLPILPIGLFLFVGFDGIGHDSYQERLWDVTFVRVDYVRIGLPALDGIKYSSGPNLLGLALSALMKLPAEERARIKADGVERIALSNENEKRRYFLAECYDNYFPLSEAERVEYQRIMAERLPQGREHMDALELRERRGELRGEQRGEQRGMQIGEQLGEQRGLQLGRLQEKRDMIARLTAKRYGPLPNPVLEKLDKLTAVQLDQIAENLLDAKSLDELGLVDS